MGVAEDMGVPWNMCGVVEDIDVPWNTSGVPEDMGVPWNTCGPPAASESAFRNSSSQKSMKAHNTMFVVNPYKYVYFLGWIPTN